MRFTFVTRNDDFTDRRTDVPAVLRATRALGLAFQEGKYTDYAAELPDRYHVAHVTRSEATAGVGVVLDLEQARPVGDPHHQVLCEPHGAEMLPRGVTWQRAVVGGQHLTFASTHRPKREHSFLWPEFDRELVRWLEERDLPVVLGMDANTRELAAYGRRLQLRQAGHGVDVVLVRRPLTVRRARRLEERRSDHHPIAVTVQL